MNLKRLKAGWDEKIFVTTFTGKIIFNASALYKVIFITA